MEESMTLEQLKRYDFEYFVSIYDDENREDVEANITLYLPELINNRYEIIKDWFEIDEQDKELEYEKMLRASYEVIKQNKRKFIEGIDYSDTDLIEDFYGDISEFINEYGTHRYTYEDYLADCADEAIDRAQQEDW